MEYLGSIFNSQICFMPYFIRILHIENLNHLKF